MSKSKPIIGRVITYHSNYYSVEVDGNVYTCFVKGMVKKQGQTVVVGDYVEVDSLDPVSGQGRIVRVCERNMLLSRPKVANVDCLVVVQSIAEPAYDSAQLDRYLTQGGLAGLDTIICISKSDLSDDEELKADIASLYEDELGYSVYFTSIHNEDSIDELMDALDGTLAVLAGQSGTGKSSLLNKLNPSLDLRVGAVSEKIARGQHTTRHVELIRLGSDTFVADTPGFSLLKFDNVMPSAIEAVFPEFEGLREQCEFDNCLHIDEPGCAIRDNEDAIAPSRYASYRQIIQEAMTYQAQVQVTSQKEEYGVKTLDGKDKNDIAIVRLKGKNREASRNTRRQQLKTIIDTTPDSI